MNRNFKPQVESLEERMVMDASGTHAVAPDLVAPVAAQTDTFSVSFAKIEYSYTPQKPDSALSNSAIVFVGGWGSSMYQYAFEGSHSARGSGSLVEGTQTTEHELGHTLGFRHEHTPPGVVGDDVWVDGKIITAHGFDTSAVPGNAGDDVLLGGEGRGTEGDTNGHGTHVAGTIGVAHSGGANALLGDGSVRFVRDGISSSTMPGFKSAVEDGDAASKPLPVLMVIANRDFYY